MLFEFNQSLPVSTEVSDSITYFSVLLNHVGAQNVSYQGLCD